MEKIFLYLIVFIIIGGIVGRIAGACIKDNPLTSFMRFLLGAIGFASVTLIVFFTMRAHYSGKFVLFIEDDEALWDRYWGWSGIIYSLCAGLIASILLVVLTAYYKKGKSNYLNPKTDD